MRARIPILMAAVAGVALIVLLAGPGEIGFVVRRTFMVAFSLVILVWPHVVGARPRALWTLLSVAAGLAIAALSGVGTSVQVGPLLLNDVLFVGSYAGYVSYICLVAKRVAGWSAVGRALIDAVTAAVGVALVLWTLATNAGTGLTPRALALGVYPLLDIVVATTAAHVSVQVSRHVPVWPWVVRGVAVQLVLDGALFWSEVSGDHRLRPVISALYPVVLVVLAWAVLHPSVRNLTRSSPIREAGEEGTIIRGALLVMGVVLAEASLLVNALAEPEKRSRALLMGVLVLLLFVRLFATFRQLTRSEAASRELAQRDPLTGLFNRTALTEALAVRLADDRAAGRRTALLHLDCLDFHGFNERFDHAAGDVLLRGIADRLRTLLPASETVFRYGADEFVILCSVADEAEALGCARELVAMFTAPIQIRPRHAERAALVVGVAVSVDQGEGGSRLLAWSDAAVTEAKTRGVGSVVLHDADLEQRVRRRIRMTEALRQAIRRGEIRVALQPIYGGTGYARLVGWEALARWDDPELGSVPPDQFIALAEETGLIGDLGHATLHRALHVFTRIRAELGVDDVTISVNVSPAQLHESGFAESVYDALRVNAVPLHQLKLEITESLLIGDDTLSVGVLEEFRDRGIGIALDDFGTGYASMTTLRRLPLSSVKLDRSFISKLGVDAQAQAQVKAVLDLVHSLGIATVVAEGVETGEQARILERLGCPMAQGWHFGRPVLAKDLLRQSGVVSAAI